MAFPSPGFCSAPRPGAAAGWWLYCARALAAAPLVCSTGPELRLLPLRWRLHRVRGSAAGVLLWPEVRAVSAATLLVASPGPRRGCRAAGALSSIVPELRAVSAAASETRLPPLCDPPRLRSASLMRSTGAQGLGCVCCRCLGALHHSRPARSAADAPGACLGDNRAKFAYWAARVHVPSAVVVMCEAIAERAAP